MNKSTKPKNLYSKSKKRKGKIKNGTIRTYADIPWSGDKNTPLFIDTFVLVYTFYSFLGFVCQHHVPIETIQNEHWAYAKNNINFSQNLYQSCSYSKKIWFCFHFLLFHFSKSCTTIHFTIFLDHNKWRKQQWKCNFVS